MTQTEATHILKQIEKRDHAIGSHAKEEIVQLCYEEWHLAYNAPCREEHGGCFSCASFPTFSTKEVARWLLKRAKESDSILATKENDDLIKDRKGRCLVGSLWIILDNLTSCEYSVDGQTISRNDFGFTFPTIQRPSIPFTPQHTVRRKRS